MKLEKLPPPFFWGKINKDRTEYHTLVDHSADVVGCAWAVLENPTVQRALFGRTTHLTENQIKTLLFFVGIHDIGKHNSDFQDKINRNTNPNATNIGHVSPAFCLFAFSNHVSYIGKSQFGKHGVSFEKIIKDGYWFGNYNIKKQYRIFTSLYKASVSHHGLPKSIEGSANTSLDMLRNYWEKENITQAIAFLDILWDGLDMRLAYPIGIDSVEIDSLEISESKRFKNFFILFQGLIQFCDWLASNTSFFPYTTDAQADGKNQKEQFADRLVFAKNRSKSVLKDMGFNDLGFGDVGGKIFVEQAKEKALDLDFGKVLPFSKLHPFQAKIYDAFVSELGITEIIEAQTGGGKTEIAILRALQHFVKGNALGFVLALPSVASARQIHKRVKSICKNVFGENCPEIILATGSDVGLYKNIIESAEEEIELSRMRDFDENEMTTNDENLRKLARYYPTDSSHKFLSGTFVICTIDQVLMSCLQMKHSIMRSFLLSRHTLIVDEVHSLDTYQTSLLKTVLKDHRNCGGVSLLLSATLTDKLKTDLLGLPDVKMPLKEKIKKPYPLLTQSYSSNASLLKNEIELPIPEEKEFDVELFSKFDVWVDLARYILDSALQGAKVCVIKNKVATCVRFQKFLEEISKESKYIGKDLLFKVGGVICPFHARFPESDKREICKQITTDFGKDSSSFGKVLVATQVVQESLDIDFDLMIVDIAPMPLILQRAGRLHRHKKIRPIGFEKAKMYVLSPTHLGTFNKGLVQELGVGSVYRNWIYLQATLLSIQEKGHFVVNEESRWRMERTVSDTDAENYIADKLGSDVLKDLKGLNAASDKEIIEHIKAAGNVDYSRSEDTNANNYPMWEYHVSEDEKVATRLGEGNLLITLDMPIMTFLGKRVGMVEIPYWYIESLKLDLTKKIEGQVKDISKDANTIEYEIQIATVKLNYSRYGILNF